MTEAEIGPTQLQAKERLGWLAATRSQEEARKESPPVAGGSVVLPTHLGLGLLAFRTLREYISVVLSQVCGTLLQRPGGNWYTFYR